MSEHHYNVKAVCRLTGLNEHTLRSWERRYRAISPSRQENRRRLYTKDDVERLRWLVQLVGQGYAIGQIALLANRELKDLVAEHEVLRQPPSSEALAAEFDEKAAAILQALAVFDLERIQLELEEARIEHNPPSLVMVVILPLMAEVGRLVFKEELSIAQEHALTALVRALLLDVLFQLRRLGRRRRGGDDPARLLVATPEGDLHEIGILAAAILAADAGYDVVYIGPNMPPEPLAKVAAVLHAKAVLVGMASLPPGVLPRPHSEYARQLAGMLPAGCDLWLGGHAPDSVELARLPRAVRAFRAMGELSVFLSEARA